MCFLNHSFNVARCGYVSLNLMVPKKHKAPAFTGPVTGSVSPAFGHSPRRAREHVAEALDRWPDAPTACRHDKYLSKCWRYFMENHEGHGVSFRISMYMYVLLWICLISYLSLVWHQFGSRHLAIIMDTTHHNASSLKPPGKVGPKSMRNMDQWTSLND